MPLLSEENVDLAATLLMPIFHTLKFAHISWPLLSKVGCLIISLMTGITLGTAVLVCVGVELGDDF